LDQRVDLGESERMNLRK